VATVKTKILRFALDSIVQKELYYDYYFSR
jgi:hypothetical protein